MIQGNVHSIKKSNNRTDTNAAGENREKTKMKKSVKGRLRKKNQTYEKGEKAGFFN